MISNQDTWESILGRFYKNSPQEGITINQMSKISGKSERTLRTLVKSAIENGKVEFCGFIAEPNICGRLQKRPAYKLVSITNNKFSKDRK